MPTPRVDTRTAPGTDLALAENTVPPSATDTVADQPPVIVRPKGDRRRRQDRRRTRRRLLAHLPYIAIAASLGVVTVVLPLEGDLLRPPTAEADTPGGGVAQARTASVGGVEGGAVFQGAPVPVPLATIDLPATAPDPVPTLYRPDVERAQAAARASRERERNPLPGCDGLVADRTPPNGRLAADDLCTLWAGGHKLRPDAAVAIARLNMAFREVFGRDVCMTDSYRSYQSQVSLKSRKGRLAARPGTSEHGWGLALDLCDGVESGRGAKYDWLMQNAPRFGWVNPAWARPGGDGPTEPWHWEFVPPAR